ncbi:VPLPA-CTERM sorting domain-containing protein [Jannaschia formosa]|uniref:VPLPA-CTERM sorting domain-containing protein n=1 Tax=Jannaschia formosa TaxID=2259592 RepID=UPI000E1B9299|nr:VPLPA-CTERM sorting domain-containing protein [Jannaschia formosa]TFL17983.1 hypothetical protein DR046_12575 [Jannaschia formosa]
MLHSITTIAATALVAAVAAATSASASLLPHPLQPTPFFQGTGQASVLPDSSGGDPSFSFLGDDFITTVDAVVSPAGTLSPLGGFISGSGPVSGLISDIGFLIDPDPAGEDILQFLIDPDALSAVTNPFVAIITGEFGADPNTPFSASLFDPQASIELISVVPSPASLALLVGGIGVFGALARRRRRIKSEKPTS